MVCGAYGLTGGLPGQEGTLVYVWFILVGILFSGWVAWFNFTCVVREVDRMEDGSDRFHSTRCDHIARPESIVSMKSFILYNVGSLVIFRGFWRPILIRVKSAFYLFSHLSGGAQLESELTGQNPAVMTRTIWKDSK